MSNPVKILVTLGAIICGLLASAALTSSIWVPRLAKKVDVSVADADVRLVDSQGRHVRPGLGALLTLGPTMIEADVEVTIDNDAFLGAHLESVEWGLDVAGDSQVATGVITTGMPIHVARRSVVTHTFRIVLPAVDFARYINDFSAGRGVSYSVHGRAEVSMLAWSVWLPFATEEAMLHTQ